VATHAGQTEYIRANSAARRHLTRSYGLKNEAITTREIKPAGGNYLVVLDTPSRRYDLTIDPVSNSVVKEKVR
jgi:hypothetical protein